MHLHGFEQIVIAKDGEPLDTPYAADTILVAPGERYTVLFNADVSRARGCGTATSSTTSSPTRACSAWSPPSWSARPTRDGCPAARIARTDQRFPQAKSSVSARFRAPESGGAPSGWVTERFN